MVKARILTYSFWWENCCLVMWLS